MKKGARIKVDVQSIIITYDILFVLESIETKGSEKAEKLYTCDGKCDCGLLDHSMRRFSDNTVTPLAVERLARIRKRQSGIFFSIFLHALFFSSSNNYYSSASASTTASASLF